MAYGDLWSPILPDPDPWDRIPLSIFGDPPTGLPSRHKSRHSQVTSWCRHTSNCSEIRAAIWTAAHRYTWHNASQFDFGAAVDKGNSISVGRTALTKLNALCRLHYRSRTALHYAIFGVSISSRSGEEINYGRPKWNQQVSIRRQKVCFSHSMSYQSFQAGKRLKWGQIDEEYDISCG